MLLDFPLASPWFRITTSPLCAACWGKLRTSPYTAGKEPGVEEHLGLRVLPWALLPAVQKTVKESVVMEESKKPCNYTSSEVQKRYEENHCPQPTSSFSHSHHSRGPRTAQTQWPSSAPLTSRERDWPSYSSLFALCAHSWSPGLRSGELGPAHLPGVHLPQGYTRQSQGCVAGHWECSGPGG